MSSTVSAVALAFTGYTVLNISQAVQKIGLTRASTSDRRARIVGLAIWIVALLASALSFVLVFAALMVGRVSVVGAMAGTGLIGAAVFGRIAMGEEVTRRRTIAIATIIAGAALVALISSPPNETFRSLALWLIPACGGAVSIIAVAAVPAGPPRGTTIAAVSGFLGAYSQLFQKRAGSSLAALFTAADTGSVASPDLQSVVAAIIAEPLHLVWIGLSFASLVVLQFAYHHTAATRIIPVYTAFFIVTPVVGGVVVFGEVLQPLQWLGIAAIIGGAVTVAR